MKRAPRGRGAASNGGSAAWARAATAAPQAGQRRRASTASEGSSSTVDSLLGRTARRSIRPSAGHRRSSGSRTSRSLAPPVGSRSTGTGWGRLVDHERPVGADQLGQSRQGLVEVEVEVVEVVETPRRLRAQQYVEAFPVAGHPVDVTDREAQDVGEAALGGGAGGEADPLPRDIHALQGAGRAGFARSGSLPPAPHPSVRPQIGARRQVLGSHVLGKGGPPFGQRRVHPGPVPDHSRTAAHPQPGEYRVEFRLLGIRAPF